MKNSHVEYGAFPPDRVGPGNTLVVRWGHISNPGNTDAPVILQHFTWRHYLKPMLPYWFISSVLYSWSTFCVELLISDQSKHRYEHFILLSSSLTQPSGQTILMFLSTLLAYWAFLNQWSCFKCKELGTTSFRYTLIKVLFRCGD